MKDEQITAWLGALSVTKNFQSALEKVVSRLVHGEGPGLMVLYGPDGANKTYFLNCVEYMQNGRRPPKDAIPTRDARSISELDGVTYQCVSLTKDMPVMPHGTLYQTPLSAVVPFSILGAIFQRGLGKGRHTVLLCDNMEQFVGIDGTENEKYLDFLGYTLDKQSAVTLLGAASLSSGAWNPEEWSHQRVIRLG